MKDTRILEGKIAFYITQNERLTTKVNEYSKVVEEINQQILMNNGSIYTLKELIETFKEDKRAGKKMLIKKGKDK